VVTRYLYCDGVATAQQYPSPNNPRTLFTQHLLRLSPHNRQRRIHLHLFNSSNTSDRQARDPPRNLLLCPISHPIRPLHPPHQPLRPRPSPPLSPTQTPHPHRILLALPVPKTPTHLLPHRPHLPPLNLGLQTPSPQPLGAARSRSPSQKHLPPPPQRAAPQIHPARPRARHPPKL